MTRFIKEFIRNPKAVGSLVPSSIRLINSMLRHIDFKKDLVIVEFGPGIGNFTKQILKRASSNSKIYLFEVQEDFVKDLKKIHDSRITIIHDGAENINKYLKDMKVDVIVSSLPFGSLPCKLTKQILKEAHKQLKEDGLFLQFQYFLQNKKEIFEEFKNYKISWQPINVPPAFVYKCKKLR